MHNLSSQSQVSWGWTALFSCVLGASYFWVPNIDVLPVLYNELISLGCWGVVLMVIMRKLTPTKKVLGIMAPAILLCLVQIVFLVSQFILGFGHPYAGVVFAGVLMLLGALACVMAGAHAQAAQEQNLVGHALLVNAAWIAVVIGGIQAVFGWVQYLELNLSLPFISLLSIGGRAYGNIRQPNNYALLLSVSLVVIVWLCDAQRGYSRRIRLGLYVLGVVVVAAVVLSASRAGMLMVCGLSAWGVMELKFDRHRAIVLMSMALWYFAFRWLFTELDNQDVLPYFGSVRRMSMAGSANADRLIIWQTALLLVQEHPWWGVGYESFSKAAYIGGHAFSMTRHVEDAHNLALQWALNYGVPATIALMGLLAWGVWKCRALVHDFTGRAMLSILLIPLGHQMVEYPLGQGLYLFPWMFLWGVGLVRASQYGHSSSSQETTPEATLTSQPRVEIHPWIFLPILMLASAIFASFDIHKVLPIYDLKSPKSYLQRVEEAYRSVLFTYLVDYQAIGIHSPNPQTAKSQLSLVKKVSAYRFTPYTASIYLQSAALLGQPCLAKAIVFRSLKAEPSAFEDLYAAVKQSPWPKIQALQSYMDKPYPVAWPADENVRCDTP